MKSQILLCFHVFPMHLGQVAGPTQDAPDISTPVQGQSSQALISHLNPSESVRIPTAKNFLGLASQRQSFSRPPQNLWSLHISSCHLCLHQQQQQLHPQRPPRGVRGAAQLQPRERQLQGLRRVAVGQVELRHVPKGVDLGGKEMVN